MYSYLGSIVSRPPAGFSPTQVCPGFAQTTGHHWWPRVRRQGHCPAPEYETGRMTGFLLKRGDNVTWLSRVICPLKCACSIASIGKSVHIALHLMKKLCYWTIPPQTK
jgi:hypothetical protein